MKHQFSRRQFLQQASLGAAGLWITGCASPAGKTRKLSANDKLNIGIIGTGNRARSNIKGVAEQNIVALCDIDEKFLSAAKQEFPGARTYNDYRKLLEQPGIDAVVISTADHTHAVATVAALQSGHHVYCEKPLTHTISEARIVAAAAKKYNRATQMGNQIHSSSHYRRVVELVQTGAIGTVTEVHCWADYVWENIAKTPGLPVPAHVHYDLWLGPVQPKPYDPDYHPFNWRRWWHFGGGTLADFCCHLMDLPYWALGLQYPHTIEAEGPPVHPDQAPPQLVVRYQYGPQGKTSGLKMTWYSGGKRPPYELPKWGNGVLFVGTKGMLLTDYGKLLLLPEKNFTGFAHPQPFIQESPGHYAEWIEACKTGKPTSCPFSYGALLTEAGLLGNVAFRAGQKLEWDAAKMRASNTRAADEFIQHHYRAGWKI